MAGTRRIRPVRQAVRRRSLLARSARTEHNRRIGGVAVCGSVRINWGRKQTYEIVFIHCGREIALTARANLNKRTRCSPPPPPMRHLNPPVQEAIHAGALPALELISNAAGCVLVLPDQCNEWVCRVTVVTDASPKLCIKPFHKNLEFQGGLP